MQWFRFYADVVNDPKVQRLSPTMFKHWVNVLCLASTNNGMLPPATDIAFTLRISEGKACEMLDELVALHLIDADEEGMLAPHNWKKRQYDEAERSESGSRGNHVRWHVRANAPNADCPYCIAERLVPAIAKRVANRRDSESDTEAETEQNRDRAEEDARARAAEPPPPPPPSLTPLRQEWENKIGFLPTHQWPEFKSFAETVPMVWFMAAIDETKKAKNPGWHYCRSVLQSCVDEDRPPQSIREVVAAAKPAPVKSLRYEN